jgi:uncharacterized protein YcgI (DUF1989 family)
MAIASSKEFESALRAHPVPGRVVREWVIPAREYTTLTLPRGQVLRVVDLEGKQVADLVCFSQHNLQEALSLGNTQLINRRLEPRLDDALYSDICNPMFTVAGFSNGESYSCGPMCSEELNRLRYGVAGTRNCRDNFALALAAYGFTRLQIPNAFCPFMRVPIEADLTLGIAEPTSVAGDYYDLRAEMDLLVAISNCPQERNPCNGFNPTALGVIVYEPG